MTLDEIRDLYRYTDWADERVLGCLRPLPVATLTRELGGSFPTLRRTLAHVISGQWVWLERWEGRIPKQPPGWLPDAELDVLEAALRDVQARRHAWLEQLPPEALTRTLEFHFMNGTPGAFVMADLLMHVVNHSTFHRGQLVTLLRQAGATGLPATDFTEYRRSGGRAGS
jgi:uncharacterized damage-inducible protein DinB